jgi:micrococcal nuclease
MSEELRRSEHAAGADLDATYTPSAIDPYQYWAQVLKVVDGDTLDLEVDLGFELKARHRFRLIGIDAPETHGVAFNTAEHQAGVQTMQRLAELAPPGSWIEVRTYLDKREKYGRYLCEVFVEGRNVN